MVSRDKGLSILCVEGDRAPKNMIAAVIIR